MSSYNKYDVQEIFYNQQSNPNRYNFKRDLVSSSQSDLVLAKRNKPDIVPDLFTFGYCKICEDKASGIHYGIATCEGCKGFFKRSLDKQETYMCSNQRDCIINKDTRNKCKLCRYKKCIQMGMSIDGIKMGRIPKSEKLKSILDSQNREKILNFTKNNLFVKTNSSDRPINFNYTNDFINWLNIQLEKIRSSCNNSIAHVYSNSFFKIDFYSILNEYKFFSSNISHNISSSNIIKTESDLIQVTLLRDRVYHIYKKHLVKCFLINNCREKLRTGDYIGPNVENVTNEDILNAAASVISTHFKWMSKYTRDLPGFDLFSLEDLNNMISKTVVLTAGLPTNEFIDENDSYLISPNGYQLSKSREIQAFGENSVKLSFLIHSKLDMLNLSEKESSLFFPFCLLNCNEKFVKNKEHFNKLKATYTKIFIYEFHINERNNEFFKAFQEYIELSNIIGNATEIYNSNQTIDE